MADNYLYKTKVLPRIDEIADWCILGWSLNKMAKELGIAVSTLWNFVQDKNKQSLQKALSCEYVRTTNVVDSLYASAIGYWKTIPKAMKCKRVYFDEQGKRCEIEEIKYVEEEVWFPADTNAIKYYLNNRDPMRWRDNPNNTGVTTTLLSDVDKIVVEIKKAADALK